MGNFRVLYSSEDIQKRVSEIAAEIARDYKDKKVLLIGVLKGAYIFMADLQRELYRAGIDAEVDFITASSYGKGTVRSDNTQIVKGLDREIKDREIVLIDDILDTGNTLYFLKEMLLNKKAKSVKLAALLDKKDKREAVINADYVGFVLKGTSWVEGYGMDSGELGRGRPDIIVKQD